MDKLDAYNLMLAAVNEEAISDRTISDNDSENYLVAQLDPVLEARRKAILLKGHPFNTHRLTLTPDNSDQISVPATYLTIRFPVELQHKLAVYNGKVYDRTTQTYWAEAVTVDAILDIAFSQIPEAYAEWIARESAVEFKVRTHGVSNETAYYMRLASMAKQTALNSEFVSIDNMTGFNQIKSNFSV